MPLEIVKALSTRKGAVRLGEIARLAKVSRQSAKYAVDKLVERGILVPLARHDILYYRLQPLFYAEGVTAKVESLAAELKPYVDLQHLGDDGVAMLENLKMLLDTVTLTKKKDGFG